MLFPILAFSNYINLFVYHYCEFEQSLIPMLFSILTFSCYIILFVHHYCELEQSVSSNVVFQLSLCLITLRVPYLYIITVNLSNLFIPMLFLILPFSNYITLFVYHYRELEQSFYPNVFYSFLLSVITLPYLYIITVNLSNLVYSNVVFNSHFF